MEFDIEKSGDVAVVLLSVESLEAGNAKEFKRLMEPILRENTKVVFDMRHLRFIDSMGCGLFLSFHKRLRLKGGGLKTCCVTAPVKNLFTLVGFDVLFGTFENREDAVNAFM